MKLFSLLFLNEAQVFASQAYNQGYVLIETIYESKTTLILIDKNNIKDEEGNIRKLGEGIIKGYISYIADTEDISSVRAAYAVKGWGPLLYQAAMKKISPRWLASDTNLSEDANDVWNKMYELTNLYERKYIGNIESDRYECCAFALSSLPNDEDVATEESFLAFLAAQNVSPNKTGCFWAYRKKTHEPEIDVMFSEGKKVLKVLGKKQVFGLVNSANLV